MAANVLFQIKCPDCTKEFISSKIQKRYSTPTLHDIKDSKFSKAISSKNKTRKCPSKAKIQGTKVQQSRQHVGAK